MVRNTKWLRMVPVGAVLAGALLAGCNKQTSDQDNSAGSSAAVHNTTTMPSPSTGTGAAAESFADAASTWSQVEMAKIELESAVKAKSPGQVGIASAKVNDLVKTLPGKSSQLSDDKRKTLEAHVRNVGELTAMMNKTGSPGDMTSLEQHQTALNDALGMIKGIYPAEAMSSAMHMPDMNSSGKAMGGMSDDDKMPMDKMPDAKMPADKMPAKGMGGGMGMMDMMPDGMMGGKGKGMGMPSDPGKTSGMGMDMMDKMTAGMSKSDKSEMKMMMDKIMAMPPAERKKAMQKMSGQPMSGMGKPAASGKSATPTATPMPMPSGGMGHM